VSAGALEFLRELERADEAVAAVLAELDELADETQRIGARALELETFFVKLPAERERPAAALAAAEVEAAAGRAALAAAEAELTVAEERGDAERRAAAKRAEVRARDALRMAERRAASSRDDAAELERRREGAEEETNALEGRARAIAAALATRSQLAENGGQPPEPGLAGLSAWATQARAALFVARGGLAREREGVIRQANELGALVLGEPLTASSAAIVTRRVEQARGPSS
jgi:chromosome segregation protein